MTAIKFSMEDIHRNQGLNELLQVSIEINELLLQLSLEINEVLLR